MQQKIRYFVIEMGVGGYVTGLRQTDGGADFALTPGDDYKTNRAERVANLCMSDEGGITGTIKLTRKGAAAVEWRQVALEGDDESLRHDLRAHLQETVPRTLDVKVGDIEHLADYELPLVVHYEVRGTMGTPTGKRLVMPADLFEAGASATFPHETRKLPVYFPYAKNTLDAVRMHFSERFEVEAVPDGAKYNFANIDAYSLDLTKDEVSYMTHRNQICNAVIVPTKDYEGLRTYYSTLESKDQESVVLKARPAEISAN